jgi:hypothetical protein
VSRPPFATVIVPGPPLPRTACRCADRRTSRAPRPSAAGSPPHPQSAEPRTGTLHGNALHRRPSELRPATAPGEDRNATGFTIGAAAGKLRPATEVARRLGHSVAVLLKVYANCIDGGEDGVNDRIGGALG